MQLFVLSLHGFTGSIAIGFGDFGRGEGLIFFSQVDCNGDEDNLYSCGRQEISQHSCTHGQDAGVICIGEPPSTDRVNSFVQLTYDTSIY